MHVFQQPAQQGSAKQSSIAMSSTNDPCSKAVLKVFQYHLCKAIFDVPPPMTRGGRPSLMRFDHAAVQQSSLQCFPPMTHPAKQSSMSSTSDVCSKAVVDVFQYCPGQTVLTCLHTNDPWRKPVFAGALWPMNHPAKQSSLSSTNDPSSKSSPMFNVF